MTQVVAGTVAFLAIVMYAWTALRFANYPAPWSAPWHTKALDRWPAAGNAALRALVLGALAVVFAWPYVQGPSSPIRVRPSPPPVATPRCNGQVCEHGECHEDAVRARMFETCRSTVFRDKKSLLAISGLL